MNNKKNKGLMAMPAVVLFTFTFAIVAIALGLITAKDIIVTKTYILNETKADMNLYYFLTDNACSQTTLTNAELLSIGIMQQKTAEEEIEINYNNLKEKRKYEDCVIKFFKNIEYDTKNNYYFTATDTITTITVGNPNTKGKKTITYIPSLNNEQIKITLVMKHE